MARCKKCSTKKVRNLLRASSFAVESATTEKTQYATMFFHRRFNLSINGVTRQFLPGEHKRLDYTTIKLVRDASPTNPVMGFVYIDEELKFNDYHRNIV